MQRLTKGQGSMCETSVHNGNQRRRKRLLTKGLIKSKTNLQLTLHFTRQTTETMRDFWGRKKKDKRFMPRTRALGFSARQVVKVKDPHKKER